MKTIFALALLTCLFTSCNTGSDNTGSKEEFRKLLSDYYDAMAAKNLAKMKECTTQDFVMFGDGRVYNNESVLSDAENTGTIAAAFRFDSLNTHLGKNDASAYYFRQATYSAKDSSQTSLRFLESATFKKEKGRWKIRFLHSSRRN